MVEICKVPATAAVLASSRQRCPARRRNVAPFSKELPQALVQVTATSLKTVFAPEQPCASS